MKKKSWIIVTNKLTYLLLLAVPCGLIKIFAYDVKQVDSISQIFVSILIILIGVYLFIRFNTYSPWYNPNHPKPNDE